MKVGFWLAITSATFTFTGAASAAVTDYTLSMNMYPENTYALVTHSNEYRGDFAWGDYTAPDGSSPFYIFNGGTQSDPLLRVFYGQANLTEGDVYTFSTLVVNNYPVSDPVLQLEVDGTLVGNAIDVSGPYGKDYLTGVGPWQRETWSFTASATELGATVSLVDTNTAPSGNDFSVSGVPETSTWAMLLIGFAGLGFAGYRRRGLAKVI